MFKQKRHKRFNYKPRFQKSELEDSKHQMETNWEHLKSSSKRKGNILTSLPALIIMLILMFLLMYILEGYIN